MAKTRLAVLVSGGGTNLQTIINACVNEEINAEVAVVISSRKGAYALERARMAQIPGIVCSPRHYANPVLHSKAIAEALEAYQVDLIILAGFMSILSDEFVNTYPNRIMNTHPALLPSFGGKGCYGQHVHQQVLDYGVKVSGATIMFVDTGIDTGPIILQEAVAIAEDETVDSLQQKVLKIEHRLYVEAIGLFADHRLRVDGRRVHILPLNS